MLFGWQRRVLESQIAEGKISSPEGRRNKMSKRALEQRISNKATRSLGGSVDTITTQDLDAGRSARGHVSSAHDEYEEHLLEVQQEMEDSDEEGDVGDDCDGTLFDEATKLYEEYKLTDGSIADRWAGEANSKLHLNWQKHPTTLSHYSHGDCGGLGLTSNMEKKLGMEPSNQKYQVRKQPALARTEATQTQNWEMAGISPVRGDEDFEMVISPTDLSLQPGSVKWSDWVDEVYDDDGYIHF
jgi:hypothetical protein